MRQGLRFFLVMRLTYFWRVGLSPCNQFVQETVDAPGDIDQARENDAATPDAEAVGPFIGAGLEHSILGMLWVVVNGHSRTGRVVGHERYDAKNGRDDFHVVPKIDFGGVGRRGSRPYLCFGRGFCDRFRVDRIFDAGVILAPSGSDLQA